MDGDRPSTGGRRKGTPQRLMARGPEGAMTVRFGMIGSGGMAKVHAEAPSGPVTVSLKMVPTDLPVIRRMSSPASQP